MVQCHALPGFVAVVADRLVSIVSVVIRDLASGKLSRTSAADLSAPPALSEPFAPPRWKEISGLRDFVVSFGQLLPLHKPSAFGEKYMIRKLMAYSGGLTGRIAGLMAQVAELAIRQGTESISLDLLDQAAAAGIFKIPVKMETDEATA